MATSFQPFTLLCRAVDIFKSRAMWATSHPSPCITMPKLLLTATMMMTTPTTPAMSITKPETAFWKPTKKLFLTPTQGDWTVGLYPKIWLFCDNMTTGDQIESVCDECGQLDNPFLCFKFVQHKTSFGLVCFCVSSWSAAGVWKSTNVTLLSAIFCFKCSCAVHNVHPHFSDQHLRTCKQI